LMARRPSARAPSNENPNRPETLATLATITPRGSSMRSLKRKIAISGCRQAVPARRLEAPAFAPRLALHAADGAKRSRNQGSLVRCFPRIAVHVGVAAPM
jgi:hypothetical protein